MQPVDKCACSKEARLHDERTRAGVARRGSEDALEAAGRLGYSAAAGAGVRAGSFTKAAISSAVRSGWSRDTNV
jgi:hypothetical protein